MMHEGHDFESLKKRVLEYNANFDIAKLEKAYELARTAHEGQMRESGEPYLTHPLEVAYILADLELDCDTLVGALLHDVVEDTSYTVADINREFGESVGIIVDGVTKLSKIQYTTAEEQQVENLRKMFLAMAKDVRVILIKLADRLHNMRTIKAKSEKKQREKARETLEVYAALAHRLGMSKIKWELEDLSLKYIDPVAYKEITESINLKKQEREQFINDIMDTLKKKTDEMGINSHVMGRAKHFYSIYRKMFTQNKSIDELYDLFAVRIIVDSIKDCYAVLGMVHELYYPIPGRFKDYIAMPKPNMYQSLHTTVIGPDGTPFEIQIRTWEMHRVAEFGIAAHWKYKEAGKGDASASGAENEKMNWLRQILEWQREMPDNKEFLNDIKNELSIFSDSVYCFTPSGDVKTLPSGSTPIDFAYSIHSAVGNRMVGAKVNGKLVNIDYQIQNGDRIDILTSQNSRGPSRDWLKIIKSTQARNKINQWFKSELKEENIIRGKELILNYCKSKGVDWSELNKPAYQEKILRRYAFREWDSVSATIGHGGLKESQVVNRMLEERKKELAKKISDETVLANVSAGAGDGSQKMVPEVAVRKSGNGIVVRGVHDLAVRFSMCCAPVPGDEILGYVTRGRGITIHRTDCINIINLPESERVRLIPAEWQAPEGEEARYRTEIRIIARNRVGLFVDISKVFTERGLDILSINTRTSKQGVATMNLSFEIGGVEELRSLTEKLRQVGGVIEIERSTG